MSVQIICHQFMNCNDIEYIKHKILYLQDIWQSNDNINFLPYGRYSIPYDRYLWNSRRYNITLTKYFSSYYEKIRKYLSDILEIDLRYDTAMSLPGFHIFGPGPLKYETINFHKDVFIESPGKILSVIIPISLPRKECGLLYKELGHTKRIAYNIGDLIYWDGDILHSIEPFELESNEYRITWQMHILNYPRQESIIFW